MYTQRVFFIRHTAADALKNAQLHSSFVFFFFKTRDTHKCPITSIIKADLEGK
jgi:hypothetical protein